MKQNSDLFLSDFNALNFTISFIKHTCEKRAHLPELLLPSSQEKL